MNDEDKDYITLDNIFLNNIKLLEKILLFLDPKVAAKLLGLCKDIPQIFNILIQNEPAPELSLRDDESTLTNFVRICFKYLFPLQYFKEDITFKHALRTEIPEPISMMCYHMERVLYKNPKSHIVSVTSIIALRGLCPKIVCISVKTAKKLMKVAGMCSLSDKDFPDEIYIIIKDSSGHLHICNKCKKWTCSLCTEDETSKSKIPILDLGMCSNGSRFSSPKNTNLHIKSESFSPRNIIHSGKKTFSKDQPKLSSPQHNIKSLSKPESPGNPYNKNYSLYDNFCRDIVYKGYRSVLLPSTHRKYDIFSFDEIEELTKALYFFTDTVENYISYGYLIKTIASNSKYKFSDKDFFYYDDLLTMEQRIKLYNEYTDSINVKNKYIPNIENKDIEVIWERKFRKITKLGSTIIFRSC